MKILNLIILLVLLVPKIQAFEEGEGNVDIEIELLSSIPGIYNGIGGKILLFHHPKMGGKSNNVKIFMIYLNRL